MAMQVPLVDLKAQLATIEAEVMAAIRRVLEATSFILGPEVDSFEKQFADFVGSKGAVGVASGTAALHMALLAGGVGPGDEVITSAHTFIATAEAISYTGARPVFADIDSRTYNLSPEAVRSKLTSKTKSVIAVHLYGLPCDMDGLSELCRARNLFLVEDAAQAHGASWSDKRCGSIGQVGCFSFYPGKNLGAYGDAGAVTSNDEKILQRVKKLRNHGRTTKYEHDEIGYAERIDALHAAILSVKLCRLEAWTEARRSRAQLYKELLSDADLGLPYEPVQSQHVYHLFVVRSPKRDFLLDHLRRKGIEAGIHYPTPLHLQPAYASLGYKAGDLPVTEKAAREVLSLPMYPEMTEEQIRYVAEIVHEGLRLA